jgi:hypothetical protein
MEEYHVVRMVNRDRHRINQIFTHTEAGRLRKACKGVPEIIEECDICECVPKFGLNVMQSTNQT